MSFSWYDFEDLEKNREEYQMGWQHALDRLLEFKLDENTIEIINGLKFDPVNYGKV